MAKDNLESKIKNSQEVNLERIAGTTIGYGLIGTLFSPNPEYTGPIGAVMGCGLSIYSELKNKDLNLSTPAWAALFGGMIGSWFRPNFLIENIPYLTTYLGTGIGGGLSLYNSFKKVKK